MVGEPVKQSAGEPLGGGVSISHTFQDTVVIPSRLPRISLRGRLQQYNPQEYHRLYAKETYQWARDNGLCGQCKNRRTIEDLSTCEVCREKARESRPKNRAEMYQWAKDHGLCTKCNKKPPVQDKVLCEPCRMRSLEIQQRSKAKRHSDAKEQGLCTGCKKEPPLQDRTRCEKCRAEAREYGQTRNSKLKEAQTQQATPETAESDHIPNSSNSREQPAITKPTTDQVH